MYHLNIPMVHAGASTHAKYLRTVRVESGVLVRGL